MRGREKSARMLRNVNAGMQNAKCRMKTFFGERYYLLIIWLINEKKDENKPYQGKEL
jgi:hypothetical protein